MRQAFAVVGVAGVLMVGLPGAQATRPATGGVSLADLSWVDAEPVLTASAVVVIPLGAGAVEQGPHLKLNSDERLARYLSARVQAASSVVIAPVMTYGFHPQYVEYPGTASLTQATARALTVDAVRALAKHGPKRFYVLNTEPGALVPLSEAAKTLAESGILLGYTDPGFRLRRSALSLFPSALAVAHADEVATSMMLFVDPSAVDMTKATREYSSGTGVLTRVEGAPGLYSRSGVLGNATVATRDKGQALVEALVAGALEDIETLRSAPLPTARPTTAPPPAPAPGRGRGVPPENGPGPSGCTPGDERTIIKIGPTFSALWRDQDFLGIGFMFTEKADMRHPDGTIERTRDVIRQNRADLFRRREYRGSIHPLTFHEIRCISPDVAIVDGKWELRLSDVPGAPSTKPYVGWCTLILRGGGGSWQIDAWRYTVDPPPNTTTAPTILKKPGWPGGPGGDGGDGARSRIRHPPVPDLRVYVR